jgi:hypothetical protein
VTSARGATASRHAGARARSGRAPVPFPSAGLKGAIEMAQVICDHDGRWRFDHLAEALNMNKDAGAFRYRTAAARMFGFAETDGSEFVLTEFGRRACSPATAAAAMEEAFLRVELYNRLYQRYAPNGGRLPTDDVLCKDLELLGVPEQRVKVARQVFLRSAEAAGFFGSGRDRLIRPSGIDNANATAGAGQRRSEPKDQAAEPPPAPQGKDGGLVTEHLWLQVLESKLPAEGEPFPRKQRQRWLELARVYIDMTYPDDEGEAPDATASHNGSGQGYPAQPHV